MASIWRHPKSKYWVGCYTDHTGKQRKRSTKQTDRDKALTVTLEWERLEDKARNREITEAQCRKVMTEILERTTGETFRHQTTEEFLKNWLKSKETAKSEGTVLRYRNSVDLFLECVGRKARLGLNTVTPADVEAFKNKELEKGKATSTVNVDLKTIRTAFNLAMRQGIIPTNPVNAVELPTEERHQRGTFTREQYEAILAAASPEWKTAIMFGYHIGARLGDAVSMRLDNIKFAERTIDYTQKKTGKFVICPMGEELEQYLLSLPIKEDKPSALLTPALSETPVGGRNGLSREFKDIMAKAKVDCGKIEADKEGSGRAFSTLSFHALRHTFVSDSANAGIPEEIRMKWSGHTNNKVHSKYTKLEAETHKKGMDAVAQFRKGKK